MIALSKYNELYAFPLLTIIFYGVYLLTSTKILFEKAKMQWRLA